MSAFSFKQTTAPLAVIFHRLERDSADGKPLGKDAKNLKLKVRRNAVWEASGADDLPLICPIDLGCLDSVFAGANAKPTDNYSNNLQSDCEVGFLVSANRDFGLLKFNADEPNGLLDLLSLIVDCIVKNDAGETDPCLDKTCKQPLMIRWDNGTPTDLSFTISVTVNYFPMAFERGTRSDDMPVPWLA